MSSARALKVISLDPKSASPPAQKEVPLGQLTVFGRISRLVWHT